MLTVDHFKEIVVMAWPMNKEGWMDNYEQPFMGTRDVERYLGIEADLVFHAPAHKLPPLPGNQEADALAKICFATDDRHCRLGTPTAWVL